MEKGRSSRCGVYSEVAASRREFIALHGRHGNEGATPLFDRLAGEGYNLSGILGPRILAVLRLINNSNFIGRSTGMSAGLALETLIDKTGGAVPAGEDRQLRNVAVGGIFFSAP
jgi:hypothetical protein